MGFTLRATLDVLPADATVIVAELLPAVVEWNRGPLAALAGEPLKDRRVRVVVEDVAVYAAFGRDTDSTSCCLTWTTGRRRLRSPPMPASTQTMAWPPPGLR